MRFQDKVVRRDENDMLDGCTQRRGNFFLGQERAVAFHMKATWNLMVPTKVCFFFSMGSFLGKGFSIESVVKRRIGSSLFFYYYCY